MAINKEELSNWMGYWIVQDRSKIPPEYLSILQQMEKEKGSPLTSSEQIKIGRGILPLPIVPTQPVAPVQTPPTVGPYPKKPQPAPSLIGAPPGTPPPTGNLPTNAIGWFWNNGKWAPNFQYNTPENPSNPSKQPIVLPDGMRAGTLPTTQREWGVALPGQAYPQVEGPGNPSWEAKNPKPSINVSSEMLQQRQDMMDGIKPKPIRLQPVKSPIGGPYKPVKPQPIRPVITNPIGRQPVVPVGRIPNPIVQPIRQIKPPRQRILPVNKPVSSWY